MDKVAYYVIQSFLDFGHLSKVVKGVFDTHEEAVKLVVELEGGLGDDKKLVDDSWLSIETRAVGGS